MSHYKKQISKRLQELIEQKFEKQTGKFRWLAARSGISYNKWKNFYYGKQEATDEMVSFWVSTFPKDANWLKHGYPEIINPFLIELPTDKITIHERLKWVAREIAFDAGTRIFNYLASQSKIDAKAWHDMLLDERGPTLEMVEFICRKRPSLCAWVMCGSPVFLQVDPESQESIRHFLKRGQPEMVA